MSRPQGSRSKVAHIWTDEEKEYLKEITPGHHYKEIQEMMNKRFGLNLTMNQIKGAIGRYKLNTGFNGQFKKGNVPVNKDTKGLTGANKTSFRTGNIPRNYRPIGSERVNVDGYIEVKIGDPNKWRLKHIHLWEEKNGPLPNGHAIIFADRDRSNLDINNLILVSRNQLLILNKNKLIKDNAELTKVAVNIAKIQEKICDRREKLKNNNL